MIDRMAALAMNVHEVAADLLDAPKQQPVLDVGAGRRQLHAYLTSHGYSAVAIDIDRLDCERAGYCDAPFIEANLDLDLPVEDGAASGAVALEVLEHLEAPLLALRRMANAVAVGGYVILSTPNVMSWASRLELLVRGHHQSSVTTSTEQWPHKPVSLYPVDADGAAAGIGA
jgi:2-polyprenyl-3-methyl-5-hydroxy-6-metoxy-1,4-benzoquinol methylase